MTIIILRDAIGPNVMSRFSLSVETGLSGEVSNNLYEAVMTMNGASGFQHGTGMEMVRIRAEFRVCCVICVICSRAYTCIM